MTSLSNVSLVERTYDLLHANRGDLARPVALVISSDGPLETCDAAQRVLDGDNKENYVVANYVTVAPSTGAIDQWQFLALAAAQSCDVNSSEQQQCGAAFPLCSSLGACGRLFAGSRAGLRNALAHIANELNDSDSEKMYAAVVETRRDDSNGRYTCREILASTRSFQSDLKRDKVEPTNEFVAEEVQQRARAIAETQKNASDGDATPCTTCAGAAMARNAAKAKQKRDQMILLGVALLLLIIAIMAIVFASTSSASRAAHINAERKLDLLYRDAVERRVAGRAAALLSESQSASVS